MGTCDHQHWHIHNLPVDNSLPPSQRCKDSFIGGHYDPFEVKSASGNMYSTYCNPSNQTGCEVGDLGGKFGPLILTTPQFTRVDNSSQLTLFGRYGIIGRSIKIHGMEDVCATIYSSSEVLEGKSVTLLQAAFVFPFGGTMYFRQVEGEDVVIFGKIYWVTDTDMTMGHNWHVHLNQVSVYVYVRLFVCPCMKVNRERERERERVRVRVERKEGGRMERQRQRYREIHDIGTLYVLNYVATFFYTINNMLL